MDKKEFENYIKKELEKIREFMNLPENKGKPENDLLIDWINKNANKFRQDWKNE